MMADGAKPAEAAKPAADDVAKPAPPAGAPPPADADPKQAKPDEVAAPAAGMHSFVISGTRFDVDKKYRLIKPIGHGAYGVVV